MQLTRVLENNSAIMAEQTTIHSRVEEALVLLRAEDVLREIELGTFDHICMDVERAIQRSFFNTFSDEDILDMDFDVIEGAYSAVRSVDVLNGPFRPLPDGRDFRDSIAAANREVAAVTHLLSTALSARYEAETGEGSYGGTLMRETFA